MTFLPRPFSLRKGALAAVAAVALVAGTMLAVPTAASAVEPVTTASVWGQLGSTSDIQDFSSVTVELSQFGVVQASTQAFSNGQWLMLNLIPGSYSFHFAASSGFNSMDLAQATGYSNSFVTLAAGSNGPINVPNLSGAWVSTPAATVTGTPTRGNVLTIVPPIWVPDVVTSSTWYRDNEVFLASGLTYTVTEEDEGHTLTVYTSGIKQGYEWATAITDPIEIVDPIMATVSGTVSAAAGSPELDPTAVTVSLRNANGETIREAMPNAAGDWKISNFVFGIYSVYYSAPATHRSVYAVDNAPEGSSVTGTKFAFAPGASTVSAQNLYGLYSSTEHPQLLGLPIVGELMTVTTPAWSPVTDFTYTWYSGGTDVIQEASSNSTYRIRSADIGSFITVRVTPTKSGYATASASRVSDVVRVLDEFTSTPAPVISGQLTVGSQLTGTVPAWTPAADSYRYIWLRNGVPISSVGPFDNTYTVVATDAGQTIALAVAGTKTGYLTAGSNSSAVVIDLQRFVAAQRPTIAGELRVGETVSASIPTWTPQATSYSYQWYRGERAIARTGTKSDYTIVQDDAGMTLSVMVTSTLEGYHNTAALSEDFLVDMSTFSATPRPVISGIATPGGTLTAIDPGWTPTPANYTYRWLLDGAPIAGATTASLVLTDVEAEGQITVEVTGELRGYLPASTTSAAVTVEKATFATTLAPTVTGTRAVGKTLTAATAAWTPAASFSYVWLRSGVAIAGATNPTYLVKPADAGKAITVLVTGVRTKFAAQTVASIPTAIALQKLTKTPKPTISGKAKKGKTLTVKAGTWSPSKVTLTYQWERNGVKISKATKSSYKLTSKDKSKKITVVVTGTKSGFATVSKESSAKKVKK